MDTNYPASRYPPYFKSPINYSQNSSYNDLYQTTQQCPPTEGRTERNLTQPSESLYYHHSHYKSTDKNMLFDRGQSNKNSATAAAATACFNNYGHGTTMPSFKENYYATAYYDQYKYCGGIGVPSINNVGQYSKTASTISPVTDYHNSVSVSHPQLPPPSSHTFQTSKTGLFSPCEKNSFSSKLSGTNPSIHHPSLHPNPNISQYMYGYGYGTPTAAAVAANTNQHSSQNLCNYSSQNCNDDTRWAWDDYQNSRRMVSSSYIPPPPHHSFTPTNHSLKETSADIYRSNHHYATSYYTNHHSTVPATDPLSPKDKSSSTNYHQMNSQAIATSTGNGGDNLYNNTKTMWPLSYQTVVPPHHPNPQNMLMTPSAYDRLNYYATAAAAVAATADTQNSNCCSLSQEKSSSNFYQNHTTKYIPHHPPHPAHSALTTQRMTYKGGLPPPSTTEMPINCNSYRFMQYNDPSFNTVESSQRIYGGTESALHYDQSLINNHAGLDNSTILTSKHNNETELKTQLNYKEFNMEQNSLNEQNNYQYHHHQNTSIYTENGNTGSTDNTTNNLLRSQNLREFLSSWNEDEDDGVEKIDVDVGGNNLNENNSTVNDDTVNENVFLEHANIEVTNNIEGDNALLENHLQFRGSFKTRPKIHVGITVDSNISSDQYINLPDIIIDIEKSKDAEISNNCINNKKIDIQHGSTGENAINLSTTSTTITGITESTTIPDTVSESLNMTSLENLFENEENLNSKMQEIVKENKEEISQFKKIEDKEKFLNDNDIIRPIEEQLNNLEEPLINHKLDQIQTTNSIKQRNIKKISKQQQQQQQHQSTTVTSMLCKIRNKHECKCVIKKKNVKKIFFYKKCCKRAIMLQKLKSKRRKRNLRVSSKQKGQLNQSCFLNPVTLSSACISAINSKQFRDYMKIFYENNKNEILIDSQEKHQQKIHKNIENERKIQEQQQELFYSEFSNTNIIIEDDNSINQCYNAIVIDKLNDEIEETFSKSIQAQLLQYDDDKSSSQQQQQSSSKTEIRWFVPKLSDLCEYALKCYYGKQQFIIKLSDDNDDDGNANDDDNIGHNHEMNNLNEIHEKTENNDINDNGNGNYSNLLLVECDINENVENLENCIIGDGIEVNLVQIVGEDGDDDNDKKIENYNKEIINNEIETTTQLSATLLSSSPASPDELLLPPSSSLPPSSVSSVSVSTLNATENDNFINNRSQESHFSNENISNYENFIHTNDKENILTKYNNNNTLIIPTTATTTTTLVTNNNNIPSILHHEEIVPENYEIFENRKFIKYLQSKYVQKLDFLRSLIINKIIKKYKKQYLITISKRKIKNHYKNKLFKKKKKLKIYNINKNNYVDDKIHDNINFKENDEDEKNYKEKLEKEKNEKQKNIILNNLKECSSSSSSSSSSLLLQNTKLSESTSLLDEKNNFKRKKLNTNNKHNYNNNNNNNYNNHQKQSNHHNKNNNYENSQKNLKHR